MQIKGISILVVIIFFILQSCNDSQVPMPKPRTYPKVLFPKKEYKKFQSANCNFEFEYPVYAQIEKEEHYFDEKAPNDCWYNIAFPAFKGKLYLTYYPIHKRKDYDKLINDSFELIAKHNVKASGRNDIVIKNSNGVEGLLFKIEGNVATQTQFFLTDTTKNFIRGSLYFNSRVNPDSIRIIQEFIDKDVTHLLNTFKWK